MASPSSASAALFLSALPVLHPSPPLRLRLPLSDQRLRSRRNIHTIPLSSRHRIIFSTNRRICHRNPNLDVRVRFGGDGTLIAAGDHWGIWTSLLGISAFGIWSEKTKIGSMVSPALVSILVGLAASNLRIIPFEAPAYSIVFNFLLPLTIPLLLFRANLRHLIKSTGRLLFAFLLGSVATMIGTLVAFLLVPMRSLGQDSWKIAAALMGSYIGGAVNYIAISKALGTTTSIVAAGVAADNVICAIYFMILFALASKVPRETSKSVADAAMTRELISPSQPLQLATASGIAVSFGICKLAAFLANWFRIQGGLLPGVTAIVVALATAFPSFFGQLAPSGEALSSISMHVFFAVIGASGSIWNMINTAPSIFLFAFIQVTVHLAIVLGLGKLFCFDLKLLLLASNANVGGPTTACGMATTKGWDSLIVPGILVGIFGISIATFLGIGFGLAVLRHL